VEIEYISPVESKNSKILIEPGTLRSSTAAPRVDPPEEMPSRRYDSDATRDSTYEPRHFPGTSEAFLSRAQRAQAKEEASTDSLWKHGKDPPR